MIFNDIVDDFKKLLEEKLIGKKCVVSAGEIVSFEGNYEIISIKDVRFYEDLYYDEFSGGELINIKTYSVKVVVKSKSGIKRTVELILKN